MDIVCFVDTNNSEAKASVNRLDSGFLEGTCSRNGNTHQIFYTFPMFSSPCAVRQVYLTCSELKRCALHPD